MGCNCVTEYPDISKDLTIEITSNHNYKIFKKQSTKNNEEIIIRSVIDDYKALNENATKINLKEKNVTKKIKKIPIPKRTESNQRITKKKKIAKYITNTDSANNINYNNDVNNRCVTERRNTEEKLKPKPKFIKVKKTHPERISYLKDITKDAFSYFYLDNIFTVFNSFNDILTIVYATKDKSIVSFDLIRNVKINSIKGAHKELITNIRHTQDISNKRDLLLTISYDSNIKLWDYNNLECLTDIVDIYKSGYLFSACFLKDRDIFYIITSNYSENNDETKVYDLTGNFIKNFDELNSSTNFIDTYYDIKNDKNYIITGNIDCVKSYDFEENKLYHEYCENDFNDHCSVIVNCKNYSKIVNLIESGGDGVIRIWNFHTGVLLKKIMTYSKRVLGICLWSDNFIFVGCQDKMIKLIDIKNGEVVNNLFGNNDVVINIKKITHPKYGDCLISQGIKDNQIKLWIKKFKRKKTKEKGKIN